MGGVIDYYFAPISGYAYLGHKPLMRLAAETGATVNYLPLVIGKVFAASETTPPFAQSDVRKSYRMADQARWAAYHGIPISKLPKHWPTDPVPACKAIIAAGRVGVSQDAASFACLQGVWVEDRDIANPDHLAKVLTHAGLPAAEILDAAEEPGVASEVEAITGKAIAAGVFGSPTYVVSGERFWGQDRIDFVAAALKAEAA